MSLNFGDKLKYLRENKGWSKTETARRLGFGGVQKYANYEYGTRQPDYDTLVDIAHLYNVSTDYLLDNEYSDVKPTESPSLLAMHLDYDLSKMTKSQRDEILNFIEFQKQQLKKKGLK